MLRFSAVILALVLAGCATGPDRASQRHAGSPAQDRGACKPVSEQEIADLFERWNRSLQTGDPAQVVANYAESSYLLPTVSNKPRRTAAEKADYFHHFLAQQPSGRVEQRFIALGCNTAIDTGLYTFTFARTGVVVPARYTYTYRWDGTQWLITSHHSSRLPEM